MRLVLWNVFLIVSLCFKVWFGHFYGWIFYLLISKRYYRYLTNQRNNCQVENIALLTKFCDLDIGAIGRKGFYSLITNPVSPISERYWARKLGTEFPKEAWVLCFTCTYESRLQILQWKILMNIYPTAIILSRMKVKPSEKCELCNVSETIDHFFYLCPSRKKLWNKVEITISFIYAKCFLLTWKDAIIGVFSSDRFSKEEIKTINFIILLAKLSISKSVYGSQQDPCIIFENELTVRKIV